MLEIAPCLKLCSWKGTTTRDEGLHDGKVLFTCSGCGSGWTVGEPWTPRQLDGSWPPGVREELAAGEGQRG